MESDLYRVEYIAHEGYAVYRHCFDTAKCTLIDGVAAHAIARFVTRLEAADYARYRNQLIDERGSDVIYAKHGERATDEQSAKPDPESDAVACAGWTLRGSVRLPPRNR